MKLLKITIRIFCVFLAVGIVLTAVFFRGNNVKTTAFSSDVFSAQEVLLDTGSFEKLGESGFIELYFNKVTSEIAVKELSQNFLWQTNGKSAELSVAGEKGLHILNSRDNSVAFSNWEYELKSDGVGVSYIISKEKKNEFTPQDIAFNVKIDYILKDGSLFVEAYISNLSGNEECSVVSLDILPGFCCVANPGKDDFIIIPDGCGGVIYPALCDSAKSFETRVYGNDYSKDTSGGSGALMGAFGMGLGKNAVAVIIDSGEELATIKAVADKASVSRVYASFAPGGYMTKGEKAYIHNGTYDGKIALCYKFLSGSNASYSEVASSCREQYIRNGSLPSTDVEKCEAVPLYLTLTGVYKSSPRSFVKVKYTTFPQALDILSRIKAKGIDSVTVRYSGVYRNSSLSFYSGLGSKRDFKELCEYASSQNISLFMDVNMATYQSFFGPADLSAAKRPDKSTVFTVVNEAPDNSSDNYVKLRFRKGNDIGDFVAHMIKEAQGSTFNGYCIGDGEFLSSDYSHRYVSRNDMKNIISSQLPAISNVCEAIADKGNMYMLKNISGVINIPMSTYYEESAFYRPVPFVQSVLHGRVIMSGTPINADENIKMSALKCIEYGVCPSFTTVYSGKNLNNHIHFDNIINDIIDYYGFISDALSGLECERITGHKCLKEGVYLTTYGDAAQIYVNYNSQPVTVNGVEVGPLSALRID